MATGLELYEALKPTVGEEAARMIAEALPMNEQIATKSDVALVRNEVVQSEQRLMTYIDGRIAASEARIYQRMLTFNITLFLGLAGMVVAIVLKH